MIDIRSSSDAVMWRNLTSIRYRSLRFWIARRYARFCSDPQFLGQVIGFGSAELQQQHVATQSWNPWSLEELFPNVPYKDSKRIDISHTPTQALHPPCACPKNQISLYAHTTSNVNIPHPTCTEAAPQHPKRFQHKQDLLESRHRGMSVASTYLTRKLSTSCCWSVS